jgi:hypothetical protein
LPQDEVKQLNKPIPPMPRSSEVGTKDAFIGIKVESSLKKEAEEFAHKKHTSVSQMVRDGLREVMGEGGEE